MSVVIGADLSFTNTGLALVVDGVLVETAEIKSKGRKGMTYDEWFERIEYMATEISASLGPWFHEYNVDLAVIEAPSHGSKFGNPHERAGLWWHVYEILSVFYGVPIQTLAPASRAKYITGSGRADKEQVLEAARMQWGELVVSHDVADATGLAMWGTERLATWDDVPLAE